MKKFIQFQESVGKTPEKIIPLYKGYLAIYDDSYSKFEAGTEEDYDCTSAVLEEKPFDFFYASDVEFAFRENIIDSEEREKFLRDIQKQYELATLRDKEQKKALLLQLQKELGIK